MSAVPCAKCAGTEVRMKVEVRKAEKRRAASLPVSEQLATIERLKRDIAECTHASMEYANDATRERHARGRQ